MTIPKGAEQVLEHRFMPSNSQRDKLRNDIDYHRARIKNIKNDIGILEHRNSDMMHSVIALERVIKQIEHVMDTEVVVPQEKSIWEQILIAQKDKLTSFTQSVDYNKDRIEGYVAGIADAEQKAERFELELESLPEETEIVITAMDVKRIAKEMRNINTRTVKLAQCRGVNYITWVFNTLHAPIDVSNTHHKDWFLNDTVYLPIGPCRVTVNLYTKKVYFTGGGKNSTFNYYVRGRKTVHPHILDGSGRPCMGTLAGPMEEALANYDIEQIMTIAQMFLQTVTITDSAGAYCIRYFKDFLSTNGYAYLTGNPDLRKTITFHRCDGRTTQIKRQLRIANDPVTRAPVLLKEVKGGWVPTNRADAELIVQKRDALARTFGFYAERQRIAKRFHVYRAWEESIEVSVRRRNAPPPHSYVNTLEEALIA